MAAYFIPIFFPLGSPAASIHYLDQIVQLSEITNQAMRDGDRDSIVTRLSATGIPIWAHSEAFTQLQIAYSFREPVDPGQIKEMAMQLRNHAFLTFLPDDEDPTNQAIRGLILLNTPTEALIEAVERMGLSQILQGFNIRPNRIRPSGKN